MKRSINQRGMVSLVICMLLMIVISLMTLSFATLSRREQRQALDKQLSTQAFYAAETGVNDATKAILDGSLTTDISDCSATEQAKINPTGINNVLDAASSISRTCVLVDQTPSQIDDLVGENASTVFLVSASGLSSVDVYWENDSAVSTPVFPTTVDTAGGAFSSDAGWNNNTPGVLTIQLIPANFPTSRFGIQFGMIYVFGYPSSSASQTAFGVASNGSILSGGCATS
jgi:Tfp pilus assembly protein PilX